MKKSDAMLREFVRRISDDDLIYLYVRYKQNLCGDRPEISDRLAVEKNIDKWLQSAVSPDEWFDMLEYVGNFVFKEHDARFGVEV